MNNWSIIKLIFIPSVGAPSIVGWQFTEWKGGGRKVGCWKLGPEKGGGRKPGGGRPGPDKGIGGKPGGGRPGAEKRCGGKPGGGKRSDGKPGRRNKIQSPKIKYSKI